jgi:hypothetical protein
MTTQEMLDDFNGYMAYGLNNVLGNGVTLAQKATQLDRAKRYVCEQSEWWNPAVTLTMKASTRTVPLNGKAVAVGEACVSSRVFEVRDVVINGSSIGVPVTYSEWDGAIVEWRASIVEGVPTMSMVQGSQLYLYPLPSAACIATGKNYVSGIAETALIDPALPDVECELPDDLARAIPYVAAYRAGEPVATTDDELALIEKYRGIAGTIMLRYKGTFRHQGTERPNARFDAGKGYV